MLAEGTNSPWRENVSHASALASGVAGILGVPWLDPASLWSLSLASQGLLCVSLCVPFSAYKGPRPSMSGSP